MRERTREVPGSRFKRRFFLVHGIARGDNGERYAHGWVEDTTENVCWNSGLLNGERIYYAINTQEFYASLHIERAVRYSYMEAVGMEFTTGVKCGPWDREISNLCSNSRRVMSRREVIPPSQETPE